MLCSFPKSTCKHALAMSQPHGQHATCTCHCSRHCAALKSMLQIVFPLYTFKKATFKSKNALMLQEHAKIWTHKEHAKSIQSSRLHTAPMQWTWAPGTRTAGHVQYTVWLIGSLGSPRWKRIGLPALFWGFDCQPRIFGKTLIASVALLGTSTSYFVICSGWCLYGEVSNHISHFMHASTSAWQAFHAFLNWQTMRGTC